MGLFFRKSVSVGPIRFNFSKSGIGVSGGFRGLRLGTGPRGAYVSMGAGGVYYRQSLGGGASAPEVHTPAVPLDRGPVGAPPADPTLGPMVEIESGSVLAMSDSSAAELLKDIQYRQSLTAWGPWVGGFLGVSILLLIGYRAPAVVAGPVIVLGGGLWWWTSARDALRRTVVIAYEMDEASQTKYHALVEAVRELSTAAGLWHIEAEAAVRDSKYHAGASSTVRPKPLTPVIGDPPIVKTNLQIPSLRVGRQRVCFFPDRVLVFDGAQVGALSYDSLEVVLGTQRMIVEGSPPRDAQVVGQTWRYVNKSGGPDRRFKDNAQLPIALYETIHFRSANGLNELLHVSRIGPGTTLKHACEAQRGGQVSK